MAILIYLVSCGVPAALVWGALLSEIWWSPAHGAVVGIIVGVWIYSLLVWLWAFLLGHRDRKIGDVALGFAEVKGVRGATSEPGGFELLVDDEPGWLRTERSAADNLNRGDTIVYAYSATDRELVRFKKVDPSEGGGVSTKLGWRIPPGTDAKTGDAGRTEMRDAINNTATFLASGPGIWGALPLGIVAIEGWGWSDGYLAVFIPVMIVWIVLVLAIVAVTHNYESMASIDLDLGYVQEIDFLETEVAEGAEITNQKIVISDSRDEAAGHGRIHTTHNKTFPVSVGDLVIIASEAYGRADRLAIVPSAGGTPVTRG